MTIHHSIGPKDDLFFKVSMQVQKYLSTAPAYDQLANEMCKQFVSNVQTVFLSFNCSCYVRTPAMSGQGWSGHKNVYITVAHP